MRILLVSLGYRGYAGYYAEALRRSGHLVTSYVGLRQGDFATRAYRVAGVHVPNLFGASRHYLASEQMRLARFVRRLRSPVEVALFVNAHQLATDDLLSVLASRGCPAGLWLLDELNTLQMHDLSLGSFDRLASFNRSECEAIATTFGTACQYVPQALAPFARYEERPEIDRPLLVGAPYPRRRALAAAMAAASIQVDLVGKTWMNFPTDPASAHLSGDVSLEETMALSTNARICLSAHRSHDAGLSPRVFEIAGAGGLIVTDNPAAAACFEPGVEMAHWTEFEEATEHVLHAQSDPAWRFKTARAGARRARSDHTLVKRFRSLLDAWDFA